MMKQYRLRFSITSLLIVTAIVALYLAANPYHAFYPRDIWTRATGDQNGIAMIHTAVRRHKHNRKLDTVDFVVIERLSARKELKSCVTITSSGSDYESSAVIELPDRAIELPADQKLFMLSDGEFTTLDADVAPETLGKFLSSFSSRSTIDELARLDEDEKRTEQKNAPSREVGRFDR